MGKLGNCEGLTLSFPSMKTESFSVGDRVAILPEWQDRTDGPQSFVVVGGSEGTDRLTISPEEWSHGALRPSEVVRSFMVHKL